MRKVIQVSSSTVDGEFTEFFALCDDGSMWGCATYPTKNSNWTRFADIPQDEEKKKDE